MKKLLSIFLALIMLAAAAPIGALQLAENTFIDKPAAANEDPVNPDAVRIDTSEKEAPAPADDEIVTLMVKLKGAPVAARYSDVKSKSADDMASVLKGKQNRVIDKIGSMLPDGTQMELGFSYTLLFNGFAVKLPYGMKKAIAELPEVEKVFVAPVYAAPVLDKTEEDRLDTSVGFINANDVWNAGYTGKGTAIAIIDTGCVVDHVAFSIVPPDTKIDAAYLENVISNNDLHAESKYEDGTLDAAAVYYSGKIPFRFNYVNGTNDVSHSYAGSDHGSHVAGIAAGNYSGSSYTGVSKDSQLVIMQVFSPSGGASMDTIFAALEDCAYLEVDSVNLSLGTDLGYTSESEEFDAVCELLTQHGVNIACAAGNGGSGIGQQYYGSAFRYALAMNPDNGLVSAPGTYTRSLCVANCQKNSPSMVATSSHGPTPDLKLKPEVTAPGANINSPADAELNGSTTGYSQKSGTSMSSPHVAGAMALLTNYVNVTWPNLSGEDKVEMINRLLMCTANPVSNTSPRTQGAGIIDLEKAITTKAYITVDNCIRPKLELGDDPDKTGVYTLSFNVVNFGSTALSFNPNVTVLTENTKSKDLNGQSTLIMGGTAQNITASCTVSGGGSFTVPANSTRSVTITVTLSSSLKSELDSKFPNGIYIDGNVVLDGTVDLVIPFLGFYGSWSKASVFDRNTYIDEIRGVNNYNIHSVQTEIGSVVSGDEFMLFGANPYISTTDWWADRCTLSPNGDNYYDRIDKVLYALIRNGGEGGLRIYNADDPEEVYYSEDLINMPKAWKYTESTFHHNSDWIEFESWAPDDLAEGAHVVFKLYHYLDYEGFDPAENECCEIVLPMTVDITAPDVTYWKVDGGTLKVNVHDDYYAAWIGVYAEAECTTLLAERAITEHERGKTTEMTLSVGDHSTVYVKVGDYGRNTSDVIELTGEGGNSLPVDLESITLSPENIELFAGDTADLHLNTVPANANHYEIEWSSSDPSVVQVAAAEGGAQINAIASGTAIITATATNLTTKDIITASSSVTVCDFEGYERVFSVEPGGKYILVADSSVRGTLGYAVGNTTVSDNQYILPVAVMIMEDDRISIDQQLDFDAITWVPSGNADDGYSWQNVGNNKYLGLNLNSVLYPSMTAVAWLYGTDGSFNNQIDSDGFYYLKFKAISQSLPTGKYETSRNPSEIRLYKLIELPVYYTVTFVDWDGTVLSTQTVENGTSAEAPEEPSREGWKFSCWDRDFSNVTEDMTVTAVYQINVYTVTFADWDGTVLSTQSVNYGDAAEAPADPEREGWTFTGWDMDFSNVTDDMTVTAQYEENGPTVTLLGDVNCDGVVNSTDALLVMRYSMNLAVISEQGLINGDMNGDGLVNATDAVLIMRRTISAE